MRIGLFLDLLYSAITEPLPHNPSLPPSMVTRPLRIHWKQFIAVQVIELLRSILAFSCSNGYTDDLAKKKNTTTYMNKYRGLRHPLKSVHGEAKHLVKHYLYPSKLELSRNCAHVDQK